jgi:hypothetical protein
MIGRDVMDAQRADQLPIHMHAIDESMAVTVDIIDDGRHFRLVHHIARALGTIAQAADFLEVLRMYDTAIFHPVEKLQQLPRKIGQWRFIACNSCIRHAIDFSAPRKSVCRICAFISM